MQSLKFKTYLHTNLQCTESGEKIPTGEVIYGTYKQPC